MGSIVDVKKYNVGLIVMGTLIIIAGITADDIIPFKP